jgi:hypothetical protein
MDVPWLVSSFAWRLPKLSPRWTRLFPWAMLARVVPVMAVKPRTNAYFVAYLVTEVIVASLLLAALDELFHERAAGYGSIGAAGSWLGGIGGGEPGARTGGGNERGAMGRRGAGGATDVAALLYAFLA